MLDGLDSQRVYTPGAATFLWNVGFGTEYQPECAYDDVLAQAAALGRPMLCLNPDLEVVKITGERFACAGVIAHQYAAMGGKVIWFGKPHRAVYVQSDQLLQPIAKDRILAVGDSLETDIPGAQAYGLDNMLVTGGILNGKSDRELSFACASLSLTPTYIASRFNW